MAAVPRSWRQRIADRRAQEPSPVLAYPATDATKAELADWLDARGIDYPSRATKAELRSLVDGADF